MDELEFRRRIMSDPKSRDPQLQSAIQSDEANAKFAEEILAFDDKLERAMKIDVPDDLADKILFQQSGQSNVVKVNFTKRALATAASIAFAFGLVVGQVNWGNILVTPAQATLSDTAIKHVVNEMSFIETLDEAVTMNQINAKLLPFAHQLTTQFPYHVYYLNHCGFGDSNAMHMVFQGSKGKVTLFITPELSESVTEFDKDGLSGVVVPMGDSSVILVGELNEDFSAIINSIDKIIDKA
ncbi:DUF3379 domain-containing protein [Vibrio sp. ZSDZ34]|uniref:DUF3379 domain-containing protein n=1 Tax=Vibrio gelatinilyticus TaxID=2893468 RepID=A0A9X2AWE6_9VIBR|nr:DUF3379 domain-containing protein [Vibrio gelatinilyticus]MCJ2377305.1 DUF3379 domain-containing protein [Vibrio gelatinilyticus]